ncbi:MAG: hypothetical protein BWY76_02522 [bacterium ADurb.Bin429]|nr:MAG: hypothetical protein BWY76_02522 [bacterium ADurb.Bin429]
MLTAKNTAFTPLYNAHIIRRPPTTFLYELLPIVVSTLAVAAGAWALSRVLAITSWLMLFACCLFFSLLFVIAVYFLALTPAERERVNLMLARVLHRVTS